MHFLNSLRSRVKSIQSLCLPIIIAGSAHSDLSGDTLEWKARGPHRIAALEVAGEGQAGFEALPSDRTGITFANRLTDRQVAENRIRENGSGVALGDIDGDGWTDIYLCRLDGDNVLYRNLGDWKFEDITEASGVALPNRFSTGAALSDVDGDGDLDLLANSIGGGTRIFHNDGKGHFTPDTQSTLFNQYGATSLAIADINNDGDLDFYVSNYRTSTIKDGLEDISAEVKRINGKIVVTPEDRFLGRETPGTGLNIVERGEPDILYVNRGKGVFSPVPWDSGAFLDARRQRITGAPRRWGLSAIFHDLNGDQHPELYVCNDFIFSEDQAYFSRQGRQFQQFSPYSLRSMSLSAMAADAADIDRDGDQDLFVVEMLSRDSRYRQRQRANALSLRAMQAPVDQPTFVPEILRNTFFLNRGDNTFAEIAQFAGLEATEWSWGVAFLDVDLDGWDDVVITNGNFHDVIDADALKRSQSLGESDSVEKGLRNLKLFPRLETRNLIFRNLGDRRFEDRSEAWGFKASTISHGLAHGDLDNDGDLDVVINHLNQEAGIYRNTSSAPRIAVRLKGSLENTHGIGAKIELKSDGLPQSQTMMSGGRYLSSDDTIQVFAARDLKEATLTVTWRNNRRTIINNPQPNHIYEIHETAQTLEPEKKPAASRPLFGLSRLTVPSRHREQPFNDFERQPLLSRQYNRLGPGLAWFDFDHDGWDDLIVGSGRGGRLSLVRNDQGKQFSEITTSPITQSIPRDLTGILGCHPTHGSSSILTGVSNYEDGSNRGAAVYEYDLSQKARRDAVSATQSSPGPIAMADIDQDGDLDLFVGGRIVPAAYPSPATSRLFLNDDGAWKPDSRNNPLLEKIGLVSSAIFTDVNGDQAPDLVLALEWGAITILINQNGKLTNQTTAWGLASHTGWWNGIATGDFNNDGKIDLAASNWGQNTRYERYRSRPLQIHYGDFNRTGRLVGIESFYDPMTRKNKAWIDLDQLALAIPEVRRRFPSYRTFSEASTESIIAPYRAQAQLLEASTLETMVFLNQGERFEGQALPAEAQLSPSFGIGVADFDGDGNHDLALGQNFFQLEATLSRHDAGRGLVLLGDGGGHFRALSGKESGVRLYGEQRSLALADFNHDGRVDIAAAESHGPVLLLQNLAPQPGLRVRLQGSPNNPDAIGAKLRLGDGTRFGPVTEIKTATGYWSQDASQVVLSGPSQEILWIQWPDGTESKTKVSPNQMFLEVSIVEARAGTP